MPTNNIVNNPTAVAVNKGGSGRATSTAYAVICGGTTATNQHQSIAGVGTTGQLLTSNGPGALPTFQTSVAPFMSTTEINFGTTPVNQRTFTITDALVSATDYINAQVAYVAPTGKQLDELEFDSFDFKCVAGAGQFTLYARTIDMGYVAGNFKINYIVSNT